MTGGQLRRLIVPAAHEQGWITFSMPAVRLKRPVKDASGYPDLTLARDGEILWLEIKGDGDAMDDRQWAWWTALQPYCHIVTTDTWESGRVAELLG